MSVALIGLCACTPSSHKGIASSDFAPKILDDDTKLFVYTQRFGVLAARDDYASIDNPAALRERESIRLSAPKASKNALEALLRQNHYCRDGYVVLDQYEQHGSYIIRGECRDSATPEERQKFPAR